MRTRSHTTEIATALRVALDVLFTNAAFCAAYWLRFHSVLTSLIPVSKGIPGFGSYMKAFPVATLVFIYMFKFFGSYARRWRYEAMHEFFLVTKGMAAGMIALMALTFLLPSTHSETGVKYSRITFAMLIPIFEFFLVTGRLAANRIEQRLFHASRERRRIVIIGTGEIAARVARHIGRTPNLECEIVGFLTCPGERGSSSRIISPVLGAVEEFHAVVERENVDEVMLTNPRLDHNRVMDIIIACEKNLVGFRHVPDMFEIMTKRVDVVSFDGVPLVGVHRVPLNYPWNRFRKRLFDILGSAIGLVCSSPAIALAAIAVKLDSRGPVFYAQERCGEDGRCFHSWGRAPSARTS
ncbi:MAG: sugar transferase [Candidatus Aureabacteria bacterium]|nr:sugar transferase [Candidatus Auribacterota bacterium]